MRLFAFLLSTLLPSVLLFGQQQYQDVLVQIDSCANYFVVSEAIPEEFSAPGTFLFIFQHRGATIQTEDNAQFGSLADLNGTGRYEVNRIASVNGDTVFAQFKLRHDYLTSSTATGITFSTKVTAPISSNLSPSVYNEATGGVLLLGSDETLVVAADLNASGRGSRGGITSIRNSQCNPFTFANDYAYAADNWRGAFKGGGAVAPGQLVGQETGRGPQLNGGGGGNDHNAGGGGGANLTPGGTGATNEEPGLFNCNGNFPGLGGRALPGVADGSQRIYLGGGGGAGHGNNVNPTAGGRGGGIIVLVAPSIQFNDNPVISVKGNDALGVDGDGGGGGGAGGSILLYTESTQGFVNFDLRGGNGGDVDNNNQNRCFGPGGGGGGGRFLYTGPPAGNMAFLLNGGDGGESQNSQACAPGENVGSSGGTGVTEAALQPILEIGEVLGYPDESVVLDTSCLGASLTIGDQTDASCFAAQWFIATPNAFESLAETPDYEGANTPVLSILELPVPALGPNVIYRLERYGLDGSILAVYTVEIPLGEEPSASFTFTTDELTVQLTNTGNVTSGIQWFLGDGLVSTALNPLYTYAASGTYELSLVVTNECGSDTTTQNVTVQATVPTASFSISNDSICLGDTLTVINLSENAASIEWSSSDNLVFLPNNTADTVMVIPQDPGAANISLCATNADQTDCQEQPIDVFVAPNYTTTFTTEGFEFFGSATGTGGSSFLWEIATEDGVVQFVNADLGIQAFLLEAGTYLVTFTASNGVCSDYVESFSIEIFEPTFPLFSVTSNSGCAPFSVLFANLTTGPVDSIAWDFEVAEPMTASTDSVVVTFAEPGIYQATLTVFSVNGELNFSQTITAETSPQVSFDVVENLGLLTTTNLTIGANSYQWQFGDGNGSTAFEPSHQYTATGTYEVTLNAFNDFCNRATSRSVLVDMISSTETLSRAGIEVYPNPSSGLFQLRAPAVNWEVFDLAGRMLLRGEQLTDGTVSIDLSQEAAGVYLLRLTRANSVYTVQLIVE